MRSVLIIHQIKINLCQIQRWSACSSPWPRSWRGRTVKARRASTRWARHDTQICLGGLWFRKNKATELFSQTTLRHIERRRSQHILNRVWTASPDSWRLQTNSVTSTVCWNKKPQYDPESHVCCSCAFYNVIHSALLLNLLTLLGSWASTSLLSLHPSTEWKPV